MPNTVPTAPAAQVLGIPTTGAAAEAKELFTVLLDRGQDFISRAILALNALGQLPSNIIPRLPDTSWIDPSFIRPLPLANNRPEPPTSIAFTRPNPTAGVRPDVPDITVAPPVFTRPGTTANRRPDAPNISSVWPTFSRPSNSFTDLPTPPDVNLVPPTFARPVGQAGTRPVTPVIPIEAAQQIIFDWLADPDPTVRRAYEAATFARAADRAIAEARRLSDESASRWAAAGFSLPPGMLNSQLDQIQKQVSGVIAQASFEAMTRAQDIQIQKYTLCVQSGLNAILDIFRTESTEYIAERSADVQALQAEVGVYSAQTQAYSTQVHTILDKYTAESNVHVAVRNADSQTLQTEAQVYTAQVQANATRAQTALSEYSTESNIYIAERSADSQTLQTEAQVYSIGVQAYSTQAQTLLSKFSSEANVYVAERNADSQVLQAEVQAYASQSRVLIDTYQALSSSYIAERSADSQALQAEAQIYSTKVQALVQRVTTELRATEIENNVLIANLQLIEKAMGEIAQAYAQLAAGATAALHASVGFEDRAQYSNSQSEDWRVNWDFRASY